MTDPADVVSAIFTLAVSSVVLLMVYGALAGWDITAISQIAASFALPFVIFLVVMYVVLEVLNSL